MLFRFFAEQTTLEETDMISAWLNEDPEKNQKVLDKAYNLYVLGIMCAPNPEAGINNSRSFLRFGWPKVLRYAGVAAAILLLGIAVDHVLLSQRMNRWLTANDCRGSGRAAYSPNVGGWLHRGT